MKNYDVELFALRTSLVDHVRFRGCSYESINEWLSDIVNDEIYELAIAMLSKSTIIKLHGTEELVIPSDDIVITHLHIINGAIASRNINIRIYGEDGYSKINIYTGQITKLGLDKTRWTWFN